MYYLQILMLCLVIAVWILIYRFWRDADIFIVVEDGESPPQTLFAMRELNKTVRIIPVPDGEIYEDKRCSRAHYTH